LDDYDPDEGAWYINEIMAEDDAKDPYLESYQCFRKKVGPSLDLDAPKSPEG